ncbi:MAG TPA: hypothetical protein VG892_07540, partial [Terriglobales bacterium]|nr:hypothetical protein [Terriglobales bacterium]
MPDSGPIRSAFQILWQRPSVALLEIAWRWLFAFTACLVLFFAGLQVLRGVTFSPPEAAAAAQNQLYFAAGLFSRSILLLLPALLIIIPALLVLWVAIASLGRAVTISALVHSTETHPAETHPAGIHMDDAAAVIRHSLPALLFLNGTRVVLWIVTLAAEVGVFFFAFAVFPPSAEGLPSPLALPVWLVLSLLISLSWSLWNAITSLAPIFVIRDRSSIAAAISESLVLFTSRRRGCLSILRWFGFFRFCLGGMSFFLILSIAASGSRESLPVAIFFAVAVLLGYSAVSNWLLLARTAAFLSLAQRSPTQSLVMQSSAVEPDSADAGFAPPRLDPPPDPMPYV